jgi:hypothetical protein
MENTELGRLWSPLHRDHLRRGADSNALRDGELGRGQRYDVYRGIEVNCVAVLGVRERLAQRTGSAVVCVSDRDDVWQACFP